MHALGLGPELIGSSVPLFVDLPGFQGSLMRACSLGLLVIANGAELMEVAPIRTYQDIRTEQYQLLSIPNLDGT